MEPKLLFYANLALSAVVFLEILITSRKNSLLKLCFLLIITSLFAMNYFAIAEVETRFQLIFVKAMRLVYVCSTILVLVYMVSPKIPRWIIVLITFSSIMVIGLRVYYYNHIDIEKISHLPNQVFSVGPEFYSPKPWVRIVVFTLVTTAIVIAYNYYRLFLMRINYESAYYKQLSRWIVSLVIPFFLLTIFGMLGNLGLLSQSLSGYLFSFFNCVIIFSLLLRPKVLNTGSLSEIIEQYSPKPGTAATANF